MRKPILKELPQKSIEGKLRKLFNNIIEDQCQMTIRPISHIKIMDKIKGK